MGDGFTCPATSTGDLKVLWNTRRSLEVPLAFDLGLVDISAVVNDAAAERGWFRAAELPGSVTASRSGSTTARRS